jgi:hypothetical protein
MDYEGMYLDVLAIERRAFLVQHYWFARECRAFLNDIADILKQKEQDRLNGY